MRYLLPFILALSVQAQFLVNPFRFSAAEEESTLLDGLVAYWNLDEASGTRADTEPTGTAQNLTDINTVTSATGVAGDAALFVASAGEYLSRTDSADLSGGDRAMFWAISVNVDDDSADRYIIAKFATIGNNREYWLRYDQGDDRFIFAVFPSGDTTVTSVSANNFGAVSTGTWYRIHFYHDPSANLIGIKVSTTSAEGTWNTAAHSTGIFDGTAAFNIGAQNGSSTFDGLMDEACLWDRILTTAEQTEDWTNFKDGVALIP